MKYKIILFSTVALTALSGCSGDGSVVIPGNGGDTAGAENRQLRTIDNSQEFYSALREGLLRQNADLYRGAADVGLTDAGAIETADFDLANSAGTDGGVTAPSVADSATSGAGSSTGGAGGDGLDVTTTNVQEAGVDEQDRMKSDGEYLYVLKNNDYYGGWLFPGTDAIAVDGAEGTGSGDAVAATTVELEILPATRVADSTVLPPQTDFKPTLRILSLQPDAPDATAITDLKLDLGGRSADGLYCIKRPIKATSS